MRLERRTGFSMVRRVYMKLEEEKKREQRRDEEEDIYATIREKRETSRSRCGLEEVKRSKQQK
jgi:hypothetical protein